MDVPSLSVTTNGRRKVINTRYRVRRKIGQGQYGKVLLASVETIGNEDPHIPASEVAIKTINRVEKLKLITKSYLLQTTKIAREIQIMKEVDHPNVVRLFQVIDDLKFDKILLVLEYCLLGDVDLKRYNHYHEKYKPNPGRYPRLTMEKILRDVVLGLDYLHSAKHIVHRDLKPLNLLISHDHVVKISDFGVSLILENNANDAKELARTMGTPAFFAPELCQFVHKRMSALTGQPAKDLLSSKSLDITIDHRIDVWLLGVTLYALIFHDTPFSGRNEFDLFKNIVRQPVVYPQVVKLKRANNSDIEELNLLKQLIAGLLDKAPLSRLSLRQVMSHPFTTFDLNANDRRKWLALIPEYASDDTLGFRLRRLFRGKPVAVVKPAVAKPIEPRVHSRAKLEAVDDLLDSYLDDLGLDALDYEDEEVEVVSSNMLGSLSSLRHESPNRWQRVPLAPITMPLPYKLGPTAASSPIQARRLVSTPIGLPAGSPPKPPPPVNIGARSPGVWSGLFSPARKMFPRLRQGSQLSSASGRSPVLGPSPQRISPVRGFLVDPIIGPPVEHTISSLSSPPTKLRKPITDLAPPPTFALATSTQGDGGRRLLLDLARLSRLLLRPLSQRLSPMVSPFGGSLARITSLLLSLNLNAYLTDDGLLDVPTHGPRVVADDDSDSDWEAEDTVIIHDTDDTPSPPPPPPHAVLMDEYLLQLP